MAEKETQQNKLENIVRLSNMIKEGTVPDLLKSIRSSDKDIKEIWGMVRKIEAIQKERLEQENLAYEREKAAESVVNAPVEKQQAEPVVADTAAKPAATQKKEEPVKQEPVLATTPEVKAPEEKQKEVKQSEVKAKPVDEKPVSVSATEKPASEAAPTAPTAPAKPAGTATARPSFLSPNQRPRPTFTPPTARATLDRSGERRPGMGGAPRGNGTRPPMNGQRPPYGQKPPLKKPGGFGAAGAVPEFPLGRPQPQRHDTQKKDFTKNDDKKTMSKRTLIRKGFVDGGYNEDRANFKKARPKKKGSAQVANKVTHAVITTQNLTVKMLSEQMGVPANQILKKLMEIGQMVTINSVVNFEDMALVADDFGVTLELKLDETNEEKLIHMHDDGDDDTAMVSRPPIVTVMGHVDHGKTSLLDALRKTSVVEGEAGGITQHIGAYSVTINGRKITFIDTPGHEAFTAMRARGAQVTDVAVIVVAADDGIMPQTIEAINHAKAAEVPIVVACNKIDKPTANIDRIKQQLTEYGVVCEEWGGDSPLVGVSAKTGQNLDKLLESILLVADLKELKANPDAPARGTIVEARLDKGKGPVSTVIVQNGTLHVGDTVVSGMSYGHIRAMTDDKGRMVKEAGPSTAVSILGFQDVPEAGDLMYTVEDEKLAKQVISERNAKVKKDQIIASARVSLDDAFARINEGALKSLNLIVKADVQGSVEALKSSLIKLSNEEVKVNVIHCAVGAINRSDVMLAETAAAIIIGFNVRADAETKIVAEQSGIEIRLYRIIYECLEDVQDAVKGMLAPKFREQVLGHAEIRSVFKVTGSGIIAGCYVIDGKIVRNAKLRVLRNNIVIGEGNVDNLKRFKDDVKEVATGYECGISIENFTDYKEQDVIEAFSLEQIKE